ncbi:hypothetical protein GF327_03865, partial [Candidatus Woesearchaeota archaeon]|nr:hypothetical protein [Candidatus Woesearchaeota archaeon]
MVKPKLENILQEDVLSDPMGLYLVKKLYGTYLFEGAKSAVSDNGKHMEVDHRPSALIVKGGNIDGKRAVIYPETDYAAKQPGDNDFPELKKNETLPKFWRDLSKPFGIERLDRVIEDTVDRAIFVSKDNYLEATGVNLEWKEPAVSRFFNEEYDESLLELVSLSQINAALLPVNNNHYGNGS